MIVIYQFYTFITLLQPVRGLLATSGTLLLNKCMYLIKAI